jgi:hypothetical protein
MTGAFISCHLEEGRPKHLIPNKKMLHFTAFVLHDTYIKMTTVIDYVESAISERKRRIFIKELQKDASRRHLGGLFFMTM